MYNYEPQLRPAGFATVPAGWVYVEMPQDIAHMRRDLPASKYRHGIIGYERKLTKEEQEQFSLREV